ncbi:glycoside hydrolase family 30 beta sandwich domain-containing protein [Streptomyces sp. NPDC057301]|uniref:glycoside hydrolase family 30 beta sandwich domain-containing protein n=1 Tax=Streptomyces sp. NPDC057301 TaxID=3346093 RepID=UPI0036285E14
MTHHPSEHLSRRRLLQGATAVGAAAAVPSLIGLGATAAQAATSGTYTIRYDQPQKQTILGLGFEIQSDTIGSGNNGLPSQFGGALYDLLPSERSRFYQQMLKVRDDRGFRYCRLALGLYFRGLDASKKHFIDRYPGQSAQLAEMIQQAGIEGIDAEYWSPAPGWKSDPDGAGGPVQPGLIGGRLAADVDYDALSDAMVADLDYLSARGIPVKMWGLQNEPQQSGINYPHCYYDPAVYLAAFKAAAPKIRQHYPDALIHAESHHGWGGPIGKALLADPTTLPYIDAWTYHCLGDDNNAGTPGGGPEDSDYILANNFTSGALGKPVFCNEYEYLHGAPTPYRTVNTAQVIMNWMTQHNAPTWFWLHALKPIGNSEASGYSLGYWRPPGNTDFSDPATAHIQEGCWDFNWGNWNAVAGFVRYMPWNSIRYGVDEAVVSKDQRIMAWKTPGGKPVFVITNRSASPFTFTVNTQTTASFVGNRFSYSLHNQHLSAQTGPTLTLTVPPQSIEFWVRTP